MFENMVPLSLQLSPGHQVGAASLTRSPVQIVPLYKYRRLERHPELELEVSKIMLT